MTACIFDERLGESFNSSAKHTKTVECASKLLQYLNFLLSHILTTTLHWLHEPFKKEAKVSLK